MNIKSLHNPRIRQFLALAKSSERKEKGMFAIEGMREISKAAENKFEFVSIFYCPDVLSKEASGWLSSLHGDAERYEVTGQIYSKIAYRENTDGIVITARIKELKLEKTELGNNPLVLVLESVEKPGNLGAILRSADAAGVDAVMICDPTTDIFNPNVIRSSLGCVFSTQVVSCTSEEAIRWLAVKGIRIYAAALQEAKPYTEADLSFPAAIVLGSEAKGLSSAWRKNANQIIKIPMHGSADSLNVSVSAAILAFEAVRQRTSLNKRE